MKGPGQKIAFAGMRLWRCPQTGHQLRTRPDVTALASPFAPGRWMMLVDPKNLSRPTVPIERFVSIIEPEPEPEPAATPAAEAVVIETTIIETIVEAEVEQREAGEGKRPAQSEESFGEGLD